MTRASRCAATAAQAALVLAALASTASAEAPAGAGAPTTSEAELLRRADEALRDRSLHRRCTEEYEQVQALRKQIRPLKAGAERASVRWQLGQILQELEFCRVKGRSHKACGATVPGELLGPGVPAAEPPQAAAELLGEPAADGADAEYLAEVRRVTLARVQALEKCFATQLTRGSTQDGDLALTLQVDAGGRVVAAEVTKNTTGSEPFGQCAISRARRWRLPGSAAAITVRVAFRLRRR